MSNEPTGGTYTITNADGTVEGPFSFDVDWSLLKDKGDQPSEAQVRYICTNSGEQFDRSFETPEEAKEWADKLLRPLGDNAATEEGEL